jgi:GT2 family glycosyltransferase
VRTTVGIPTYERPDGVARLLNALLTAPTRPNEILVVDDGDSRETAAVVADHKNGTDADVRIRYIHRSDGNGLPSARNAVLERCQGDVVCFLDDDTLPRECWLPAIHETYRRCPNIAAVGGPALLADDDLTLRLPIDSTTRNRNVVTKYGEVNMAAANWVPPRPVRTDTLIGANMSFRTDILTTLGGFDPGYGGTAVGEETDVMVRLASAGHELVYHPDACVYHFKRSTGGVRTVGDSECYWAARNGVRFRWKHFPDRFPMSIARTLVWNYDVAPDWWTSLGTVVGRNLSRRPGSKSEHDIESSGIDRSGVTHRSDWWRSLIRSYGSAPLWKRLLDGFRRGDSASLGSVAGYFDGLRYETDLDLPGLDDCWDGDS